MHVHHDRDPFLIEFSLEELQHIEQVLSDARAAEYQRAKQLLAAVKMDQQFRPEQLTKDTDAMLATFEELDLWNETLHGPMEGSYELDEDWDDWMDGPNLPCHLMPRPGSGR